MLNFSLSPYDQAVSLLENPSGWCEAADIFIQIRDSRAIIPIMHAYEQPVEESRVCLMDALDALGAVRSALLFFDSQEVEERRLAVHLMELFPDETFLPALEHALRDPAPEVRRQARRSLNYQMPTSAWEALMIRNLEASDEETRIQAIHNLSRQGTPQARQALENRLGREPLENLRQIIRETLSGSFNTPG
jgi:hypothetical protein